MLCIIVPNRRTACLSSFREFIHDGCWLDHGLSVSCTKEMHAVRKLSVWYKLPISNTVYPKTKDAFPIICVAWRFCREYDTDLSGAISSRFLCPRPPLFTLHAQPKPPCYGGYFSKNTSLSLQQVFTLTATKTSHEKWIHSVYRDYSNSLTLSNASELFWSWISINHIQVHKEKENFVIACLRPSQNVKLGIFTW